MTLYMIYCLNEEIVQFRERHSEIIRQGDQVKYRSVKYRDFEPCDVVITLPRHKDTVEEIFRGKKVKIEYYDGSKKGPLMVGEPKQPEKKDATDGKQEVKAGAEESRPEGRPEGRPEKEEVKPSPIPISRNTSPKRS